MAKARTVVDESEAEGAPPAPNYRVAEPGGGGACDSCFHRRGDGMRCNKFAFGAKKGYQPNGICDDFAPRSVVQDRNEFFFDANLPQPETEVGEFGQTLANVEVFRAGVWNGDQYSGTDLDEMVGAFDNVGYVPPVKLGHTDDPGAPAYGWVTNLRRQGDTLLADFADVPDDMIELIRDGRYDAVSSEIFFNLKRNGDTFPKALKAVAIIGAHPPGVSDLKPLRASLNAEMHAAGQVHVFTAENTRRAEMATTKTADEKKTPDDKKTETGSGTTPPVTDSTGAPIVAPGDANTVRSLAERNAEVAELKQKIANLENGVGGQFEMAMKLREQERQLAETSAFIEQVKTEKRAMKKHAIQMRCSIPSFREFIGSLAEMAIDRDEAGKTVLFTVRDQKGGATETQISAVNALERFVDEMNGRSAYLFGEVRGGSHDYHQAPSGAAPNAQQGGDPSRTIDTLVKAYRITNPSVSYSTALDAVLRDPAHADVVYAYQHPH